VDGEGELSFKMGMSCGLRRQGDDSSLLRDNDRLPVYHTSVNCQVLTYVVRWLETRRAEARY